MKNRVAALGGLLIGLALSWFWWSHAHPRASGPGSERMTSSVPRPAEPANPRSELPIAELNAPSGSIQTDVHLLQDVFVQWQTNFAGIGNPVGTNAEITAALTGANRLQLELIPRHHPAINARGELCDRWGTPFRFHQLSGTQMQIISAGPDRDFATADDVTAP